MISSSTTFEEAQFQLREIESENFVRAQKCDVLTETRVVVRSKKALWKQLSWAARRELVLEADRKLKLLSQEAKVERANAMVERRTQASMIGRR
jgi:hypothetical protein